MVIYAEKNYKEVSKKAANIMAAQITLNPKSVLGLATGSTPVGMYQQLIKKYEKGEIDFSNVTTVNLDEYKGLAPENDQSYRYFMNPFSVDGLTHGMGFSEFAAKMVCASRLFPLQSALG